MERLENFRIQKAILFNTLTIREVQVLVLIAEGKNNPDIASSLGVERATVQNHRAAIREKLGIKNETDYFKFALSFDLINF